MKFTSYDSRYHLMEGVAARIIDDLEAALVQLKRVTLSVPGGTTPGPVFDILAKRDLDWARVDILLNDERWVGAESTRSNSRLLEERLLVCNAAKARLVPLYLPYETPEQALSLLAEGIATSLPISVLLLGMGPDLHTASLFPGADLLDVALANDAPLIMAMRADAAQEPRITLTARVLTKAHKAHVLITGTEKKQALLAAVGLPFTKAPINIMRESATFHWAV